MGSVGLGLAFWGVRVLLLINLNYQSNEYIHQPFPLLLSHQSPSFNPTASTFNHLTIFHSNHKAIHSLIDLFLALLRQIIIFQIQIYLTHNSLIRMQEGNPNQVDLFCNDLYQFTCSYSYFLANKHQDQATFEVFFRKYPFAGQYTIFAGLEAVKNFILNFQFTLQHQQFLKILLPNISQDYIDWLKQDFRSKVTFKSMREGEIAFAKEPLITYTGPLGFVQILETPILNLVGFASLVATNASRMVKAISPKICIEFGLRRAQGPNGGFSASQYAYLGGFSGTSNVKASQLLGIPCYGTMSHAFITSFSTLLELDEFQLNGVPFVARCQQIRKQLDFHTHEGELAAFIAYAKSFSHNYRTLIDTFSTLKSGLLNTIVVAKALAEIGILNVGIRLDSGDLCKTSIECRKIWDQFMPGQRLLILASDDLHEERLVEMQNNHSQIDIYAIGTHIATCKKQPALGLVCKLVQINNEAKMKFSEDGEKATWPGIKEIYRVWTDEKEECEFDVIACADETFEKESIIVDQTGQEKAFKITKIKHMNQQWNSLISEDTLTSNKQYLKSAIKQISPKVFSLQDPEKYHIYFSRQYHQLLIKVQKINAK